MQNEFLPDFEITDDQIESTEATHEEELPEGQEQVLDPNATAAYEYYKDKGFLTVDQEFDGTAEGLQNLLDLQYTQAIEQFESDIISKAPDFAQPLIDLVLTKGKDFTITELKEVLNLVDSPVFDMSKPEDQEAFMRKVLKEDGVDDDEIEEEIEDLKYRDKLEKAAKRAFAKNQNLVSNTVKDRVAQAKDEKKDSEERQAKVIEGFVETVKELNWSKDVKTKVATELQSGNFSNKITAMINDPKTLPYLVDFVRHYADGKLDLERYSRQAFSTTTKKVADKIKNYWSGSSATSKQENYQTGGLNLEDYELEL